MRALLAPRNRPWLLLAVWGLALLPFAWRLWLAVWPTVSLYWTWQLHL